MGSEALAEDQDLLSANDLEVGQARGRWHMLTMMALQVQVQGVAKILRPARFKEPRSTSHISGATFATCASYTISEQ